MLSSSSVCSVEPEKTKTKTQWKRKQHCRITCPVSCPEVVSVITGDVWHYTRYISLHYQTTFTILCLVYKTVVHRINKTQLSKARIIIYIIFNIQYLRRCSLHKTLVVAVIFRGGWATISFFSTKPQSYFCLKEAKHFGPLRLVFFLPQFLRNKSIPLKVLGQGPPATLQLHLCQKLPSC